MAKFDLNNPLTWTVPSHTTADTPKYDPTLVKSSHAAPIGGDYRLQAAFGKPIYIISFLILTLVIYWTVGRKGAFYFLILVLVGQLIGSASEISKGIRLFS